MNTQLELIEPDPLIRSIKCGSDLPEVLATLAADGFEVVSVSVVRDGYVVNAQRVYPRGDKSTENLNNEAKLETERYTQ